MSCVVFYALDKSSIRVENELKKKYNKNNRNFGKWRECMKEPILVVLAAGMGSRYGGLKQIDAVGRNGEIIIDYSIYDAIKAGFKRIIFIINHKIEADFKAIIGERISAIVETKYVYQELGDCMPAGFSVHSERIKPWGTVQALLCCGEYIDAPFAVINSDDYYGKSAFTQMYAYLKDADKRADNEFAMVGYILSNTLTDFGDVTRGVCETEDGYLTDIVEVKKIVKKDGGAYSCVDGEEPKRLSDSCTASMNFWGFTPFVMGELKKSFNAFIEREARNNPLKAELPIPSSVGEMIADKKVSVFVMKSDDRWHGVTYIEDKPEVQQAMEQMTKEGIYPEKLWS